MEGRLLWALNFRLPLSGTVLGIWFLSLTTGVRTGVYLLWRGHTSPSAPGLKTAAIEPPEDAGSGLRVWGRGVTFYSFLPCP